MSTEYCDDYTYERAYGHLPPRAPEPETAVETKVVWPESPDVKTK